MELSPPPVLFPPLSLSQHTYNDTNEDTPIPSIEQDLTDTGSAHPSSGRDSGVFDPSLDDDLRSSPDTSPTHSCSEDNISELPESRVVSCSFNEAVDDAENGSVVYTPNKKSRPPFRTPSSVRAIQLDTTPPHLRSGSASRKTPRYNRVSNVSANSTPRSIRSFHSARSPRHSPTKSVRKEHPLVLLHVTLLPVSTGYSQDIMEAVLPKHVIDNYKLLREKVGEMVIERGILIPHPREDYDVLEERLLESLELKLPRILQCGHFHLSPEEEEDVYADDSEEDEDAEICDDCGMRIKNGLYGAGEGNRRWNIKIYASNGLMRAGAWAAAWREMERVDVEILPWIDDHFRREMDALAEEELTQSHPPVALESRSRGGTPITMDEERRREIYGENPPPIVHEAGGRTDQQPQTRRGRPEEPPMMSLLLNYFRLLLQDRRNITIMVLSVLVLVLAVGYGQQMSMPPTTHPEQLPRTQPTAHGGGISTTSFPAYISDPTDNLQSIPLNEASLAVPQDPVKTQAVAQESSKYQAEIPRLENIQLSDDMRRKVGEGEESMERAEEPQTPEEREEPKEPKEPEGQEKAKGEGLKEEMAGLEKKEEEEEEEEEEEDKDEDEEEETKNEFSTSLTEAPAEAPPEDTFLRAAETGDLDVEILVDEADAKEEFEDEGH